MAEGAEEEVPNPIAGGLEVVPPPPCEDPSFEGEKELFEDERKRWLILHVALPRTIMTYDLAQRRNTEAELNDALSNLAWGSIDTEAGEWTLESPDPSLEPPHSSLITYADYVARTYPADRTMEEQAREENLRLAAEKRERFTMPGEPGSKFRSMFDQMIKNLQHSNKALAKAFDIKKVFLKEEELPEDAAKSEAQNIMRFGRHQILPSFWNLLIQLTKQQRRFSVVLRSFNEEQLIQAQKELQLFVQCQHPAYNGQNKTHKPPLMDGNKGSRDLRLTASAIGRMDRMSGALRFRDRPQEQASTEASEEAAENPADSVFRPTEYAFPPYHEAYSGLMHQVLETANTAAIVDDLAFWDAHERDFTAGKMLLIDRAETKVQHIFFDGNIEKEDANCVDVRDAVKGEPIPLEESSNIYLHRVDFFQAVTDIDYFVKATEACELKRSMKIVEDRRSEGIARALSDQERKQASEEAAAMTPKEWLYRNVIPALLPALEACQRDRPEDPIEFIAFYMLRHSKQYSKTLKA
ncbi:unnamed protein product [Durusdinium trenchii]|uniref:Uncharacterized protein n=2 Tax=Durusdinium trenchii TaxID=1381693 RepID=A0ABP0ID01_9DINO